MILDAATRQRYLRFQGLGFRLSAQALLVMMHHAPETDLLMRSSSCWDLDACSGCVRGAGSCLGAPGGEPLYLCTAASSIGCLQGGHLHAHISKIGHMHVRQGDALCLLADCLPHLLIWGPCATLHHSSLARPQMQMQHRAHLAATL